MNPEIVNELSWGMLLKLRFKAMLRKQFNIYIQNATKWKNRNTKRNNAKQHCTVVLETK